MASSGKSRRSKNSGPTGSSSSQERRTAQREALRKQRQAELRRQRNLRTLVISLITVAALVIVAGIGYGIYRATRPAGPVAYPAGIAQGQTYFEAGAPEDSGKPVVDLYMDFMCPYCGQFHQVNGKDIDKLVADNDITLHLHMRRFLDQNSSTGDYSTRSANAAACVYDDDPDNIMKFQDLLFNNQPEEGSAGLDDKTLISYAEKAGASDDVAGCINHQTYKRWVREVVEPEAASRDAGTPAVFINDEQWSANSNDWSTKGALKKAIEKAAQGKSSDGGKG